MKKLALNMTKLLLLTLILTTSLQSCKKEEKAPTKMFIKSVTVTRYPITKTNGGSWDTNGTGADIYITIERAGVVLYEHPFYHQNATAASYTFDLATPLEVSPTGEYAVNLYDYDDFSPAEFMGALLFTPYTPDLDYPTILNLRNSSSSVEFDLSVSYDF